MASSSRSALSTLHTLARSLPSGAAAASSTTPASSLALSSRPYGGRLSTAAAVQHVHQHQQVRHASFSGSFLRNLIPRRRAKKDDDAEATTTTGVAKPEQQEAAPKGLFDTVTEDEDVLQTQQRSGLVARPPKPATFVRRSRPSSHAWVFARTLWAFRRID